MYFSFLRVKMVHAAISLVSQITEKVADCKLFYKKYNQFLKKLPLK